MTLPVVLTRPHNNDYLVTESIMSMELANPELKVSTCIVKTKRENDRLASSQQCRLSSNFDEGTDSRTMLPSTTNICD